MMNKEIYALIVGFGLIQTKESIRILFVQLMVCSQNAGSVYVCNEKLMSCVQNACSMCIDACFLFINAHSH